MRKLLPFLFLLLPALAAADLSPTKPIPISKGGTGQSTANNALNALLPSQASSSNKYLKTDGTNTSWAAAAGGSGGVNYLAPSSGSDNSDLETSIGSWLAYADAAGTSPVDGTGGAPTLTCTRTTSSPLRGTGSLLITKDAANRQGEGCSVAFTIDRADLAKPLMVEFDYEVASGTYDAGSDTTDPDLVAYVYGPTDGTPSLIQLAPYKVLGGTSGTQLKFQGRFQTASSGVAYRLILHEAKTGTSAYTAKLDNVKVGPEQKSFGPAVTDWTSFTPTGSWSTNTTYSGMRRRVGDTEEFVIQLALSGAPTATALTVNLPVTIDTAKVPGDTRFYGEATIAAGAYGATQRGIGYVFHSSTTAVAVGVIDDNAASGNDVRSLTHNDPATLANGDRVVLRFKVPVVGYSSNVQMSNEADTREVSLIAVKNAGSITADTTIPSWTTVTKDTHGAFNSTTGVYTVPVPGRYQVNFIKGGTGTTSPEVRKNGSLLLYGVNGGGRASVNHAVDCVAGDTLSVATNGNETLNGDTTSTVLSIFRLSGPAQIAATETVAARYTSAAGQSIPDSTYTVVDFGTKDFDTHGAVTTGAGWKFTAPIAGKYRVNVHAVFASSTFNAGSIQLLRLFKNGSSFAFLYYDIVKASATNLWGLNGAATTISLVAGDYIDVRAYQAGMSAARSFYADAEMVYITIERIGN